MGLLTVVPIVSLIQRFHCILLIRNNYASLLPRNSHSGSTWHFRTRSLTRTCVVHMNQISLLLMLLCSALFYTFSPQSSSLYYI